MSITAKAIYAPLPSTERGKPTVLGGDPKGVNFLYASGSSIVIRNIEKPEIAELYQQHTVQTTLAKYSPSGFYIASADVSGKVRIWDTVNKEHILKLEVAALGGRVNDLAWTDDSKRIVCVGEGKEMFGRAFFADSGGSVGEIGGASKNLITCDLKQQRPYRLVTGGENCDIGHFNGVPFKWQKRSENKGTRFINSAKFSPDGKIYAVGSADKLIQLYDGKTGDRIGQLPTDHKGGIYALSWNKESSQILSSSGDKTCKLWDIESQKVLTTFTFGKELGDQQLGNLWQDKYMLSVNLKGEISYLDANAPDKPTRVLSGHQKFVTAFEYDSKANEFYSGSYDSELALWAEEGGEVLGFQGKGHTSQINSIAVQNGNLVTASTDHSVRITSLQTREYLAAFDTETDATGVVAGIKNNSLIIATALDGIIRIKSGESADGQVKKLKTEFGALCVALNVEETLVAVGGDDFSVRIYEIGGDELKEVQVLKGHRGKVKTITFSPDGNYLASACDKRDLYVWNTSDYSVKTKAWGSFHDATINSLAFTPDSLHLASGGLDQNVFVWTIGKKVQRICLKKAHAGGVNGVKWVTNNVLATIGQDNSLKTWEVVHK